MIARVGRTLLPSVVCNRVVVAIRSFSVGPLPGLIRAEASELGNFVVLAGPNGAGKSSLLDLLRGSRHAIAEPGTEVLFVGPNQTWRGQPD